MVATAMKDLRERGSSLRPIFRLIGIMVGFDFSLKKIIGKRARNATPPAIRKIVLNPKLKNRTKISAKIDPMIAPDVSNAL